MIQTMTFEQFEEQVNFNIKTMAPKLLQEAKNIMISIGEEVTASIFTRALQSKTPEKELQEIINFYKTTASRKRGPAYNNYDYTIVYEKITTKDTGMVVWSYYKLVVFDTVNMQKIKKLLKISKLKAFI